MSLLSRVINKFWRSLNIPVAYIHLEGSDFKVPRAQNYQLYPEKFYKEKWLLHLLGRVHKKRSIETFVDVGVNIGQTLLKIKSLHSDIRYVGFEPNLNCCSLVQTLISINQLKNATVVPCGLSEKNGIVQILTKRQDPVDSTASVIKGFRQGNTHASLAMAYKMDDILSQLDLKSVDVIKIDIEGGELEAIKGMVETLRRYQPIIILEVLPPYNDKNQFRIQRQNELSIIFERLQYKIFWLKGENDRSLYELSEFPVHDNLNESDYLIVPKSINLHELGF